MKKITRRDFLKVAAVTTAAAVPLAGYGIFYSAKGKYPGWRSPFLRDSLDEYNPLLEYYVSGIPLLVLYDENALNPFGKFLGEILTAEGFNCFATKTTGAIDRSLLENYDLVLLAESSLSQEQIASLEYFVDRGGILVSMRPSPGLSALMGIKVETQEISDGYIQAIDGHPITDGIEKQSLQFHGTASLYQLAGAQALAWISPTSTVDPLFPAITVNQYGEGYSVAWAYDLAKSVVYTRQGNPIWADQERDGLDGIRTIDMFPQWIDLDRISIPQADEQQRLLVKLLTRLSKDQFPLPRFWYFPEDANGILVATSDSHMNSWDAIEKIIEIVEEFEGHLSIYYTPQLVNTSGRMVRRVRSWITDNLPIVQSVLNQSFGSPTPQQVENWRNRGHEFTLHPYVEEGLEQGWNQYILEFTGRGYGPLSSTTRTHRILWKGWVESAKLQASIGIGMNLDFYNVGPSFELRGGGWGSGYFIGSGQAMRFIDENGEILSIYQQPTQLADDHLIDWSKTEMSQFSWTGWPKLSGEAAAKVYRDMLFRSIQHHPSAIAMIFHTDPIAVGGESAKQEEDFLRGSLGYALEKHIPVISAEAWNNFINAKNSLNFQEIKWQPEIKLLEFDIIGDNNPQVSVSIMVPLFDNSEAEFVIDSVPVVTRTRELSKIVYAVAEITAQPHHVSVKFS